MCILQLVVHGVWVLRAQSVRVLGTEPGEVYADLFLEESDDGRDVRDLRVRRPRRLGLLEREAALQQILLDVPDAGEFRDNVRQIQSGGPSRRRHAHHFVVQVLDRLDLSDVASHVPAERDDAYLVPDRGHLRLYAGARTRVCDGHFLVVNLVGHAEPHERWLPSSVDRRGKVDHDDAARLKLEPPPVICFFL